MPATESEAMDTATALIYMVASKALKSGSSAVDPSVHVFVPAITDKEARRRMEQLEQRTRASVAREFARHAQGIEGVREVWAIDSPGTVVTVVTDSPDLERDLRLEATFRLAAEIYELPLDAQLGVYAESEGVPVGARSGERIV